MRHTTSAISPRRVVASSAVLALVLGTAACGSAPQSAGPAASKAAVTVRDALYRDVSAPLSSMRDVADADAVDPDLPEQDGSAPGQRPTPASGDPDAQEPVRTRILPHPRSGAADTVVQRSMKRIAAARPGSPRLAPTPGVGFDSVGAGFAGFSVRYAPPDTDSAVGPTQIVTVVNTALTVQDKTGTVLYGPVATNSIWSGFGGYCQSTNNGDGVVRYDTLADRWVITQFANVSSTTGPFYECIAVSTTGNATGTYNRYAFQFANFPDYPKVSVWPDGYYVTYNMFNASGTAYVGGQVCAMDRVSMIAGAAASQVCFSTSSAYGGLLASDLDGSTPPPTGAPNLVVALGATNASLAYWNFHVDYTTPANSTLTGPTALAVAQYSPACGGGSCIPQSGTTNVLDSLADRLMNRLVYRNFGDHQALVVSHSVTAGASVGVRWYELRLASDNVTPSVYQQGTFAPDSSYRWMPSAAFDKAGNIGIGYSLSSSSTFPGIAYSGRLAGDTLGTLTQGETIAQAGGGSQTGTLRRWGDYATMNIDPADGCTFWFSTEYLKASGSFNWSTRISSFTLPGCLTPSTYDFSVALSSSSGKVVPGGSVQANVSTLTTVGTAQPVSLSATGLPTGATASFSPSTLVADGTSVLAIATSANTPAGSYPITVTGAASGPTRSATFTLTVSDFGISLTPTSGTVAVGSSITVTVSTITTGVAQSVSLSASGLPAGVTAVFNPATVTSGSSSVLTLTTSASTALATNSITVTGTGTALSHSANYSLTTSAGVSGSTAITNGGFETGTLSGWTTSGPAESIIGTAHTGSWAERNGSTAPTVGDSSISQSFTAPTGTTVLSFWYNVTCPDTVRYDWATATLKDVTTNKTTTVLAKTCTKGNGWVQVRSSIVAGHQYVVTLTSHDDNNKLDPSYTLFDDVTLA
jgi:hypothetical protein